MRVGDKTVGGMIRGEREREREEEDILMCP